MGKVFRYIFKFLYFSNNKCSIASFFPVISIAVGTIIILLTLGIMGGMEQAIFGKMESFHFTYQGDNFENSSINSDFNVYRGSIKKYLIFKNEDSKVVSITSINNFKLFEDNHIEEYLLERSNFPGIFIGKGLAELLEVKVGDKISILSPLDFDIVTGTAPIDTNIYISGIFNYNILDYDYNYAFAPKNASRIFDFRDDKIFLKSLYESKIPSSLIDKYNLLSFEDLNRDFMQAINTEKLLYSIFGYIVIFIAALSSISLISLFIIKKKKEIAVLQTLGFEKIIISKIFLFNALIVSLIGVGAGSLIFGVIVIINSKFNFIQNLFFDSLLFDFSIYFSFAYVIQALLICSILMLSASIYPVLKILEINLGSILNEKM